MEAGSDRDKIKNLIFNDYPNGYSPAVSGYGTYILKDKDGNYRIQTCTSGMSLNTGEMAIKPKYYNSPEEMFNDLKLYFNPKN